MSNNLIFEKKWIFKNYNSNYIINFLHRSKFNFIKQYESRKINSIYFDDKNLTGVKDNLEGNRDRFKVRLRWYGNSELIVNPTLEVKIKKGLISKKNKINFKLNNFEIKSDRNLENLTNIIHEKILNINLKPKILISYERDYFFSSCKLIRSTIDKNIKYKKFNLFFPLFYLNMKKIILEFKYSLHHDGYVRKLINDIPHRYSKSSKYVMCMLENSRESSLD
jgi:SPX domain protein involved in polyphosphate accumulation